MLNIIKILFFLIILGISALKADSPDDKWVQIPSGKFYPFFADTTIPLEINSFKIMSTQVTNADYLEFVKKNPKWQRSKIKKIFAEKTYLSYWESDTVLGTKANPQAPVVMISWFAANAYCEWKGGRLADIREWEYVASASKTKKNSYQDEKFSTVLLGLYENMPKIPLPNVGERFKNYYGVYDMHGLVWEWTRDFNSVIISSDSRDKSNVNGKFFCAAGSIGSVDPNNYAAFVRYSIWSSLKAKFCLKNLGFRCVK